MPRLARATLTATKVWLQSACGSVMPTMVLSNRWFLGWRIIADTNRAGAPITVDLEQRDAVAYSLLNADAVTCA
jgi:hypothetical protein